jgi:nicotinate-nucleotide adenylyltransferase
MRDVIGILGGTFDPIHCGHIGLATDVRDGLGLREVRIIPAGEPWHRAPPIASRNDRMAMTVLACAETEGLVADDRETRRAGATYTVDTLHALRRDFGDAPLALIIGSDAFADLHRWHLWQELFALAHVVVAERPGVPLSLETLAAPLAHEWRQRYTADAQALERAASGAIVRQPIVPRPISATEIRRALAHGGDAWQQVRGLLPRGVLDYIARNHLYERPDDQ